MKGKIEALVAAVAAVLAAGVVVWLKRKRVDDELQLEVADSSSGPVPRAVRAPARATAPADVQAPGSQVADTQTSVEAETQASDVQAAEDTQVVDVQAPVEAQVPVETDVPPEDAGADATADEPAAPDDLTSIRGIGAANSRKLEAIGVTTFAEIAAWTNDDINEIGEKIDLGPSRIKREDWVGQAQAALKE